ncbi:uncharacterized protein G2W53_018303 [Senna tora]|uniref:Uncharacterized protein n=1 Tax=Senna tora TaxID=362788 RepID=A0A834TSS0_9FABA|nr:uncharacterized protein G2W53_018303 [Senna tora]
MTLARDVYRTLRLAFMRFVTVLL